MAIYVLIIAFLVLNLVRVYITRCGRAIAKRMGSGGDAQTVPAKKTQ